jgi:hypothetical protein
MESRHSANSVRRHRLLGEAACRFRNYVCPSTNPSTPGNNPGSNLLTKKQTITTNELSPKEQIHTVGKENQVFIYLKEDRTRQVYSTVVTDFSWRLGTMHLFTSNFFVHNLSELATSDVSLIYYSFFLRFITDGTRVVDDAGRRFLVVVVIFL